MIAYAVVGHPKRIEQAAALAHLIGADLLLDHDSRGAGWNHRRALRWGITQDAPHILVLEDDALPIDGFTDLVRQAIEQRPDQILGLYVGRQRPEHRRVSAAVEQAEATGASWLTYPGLLWGVATVWPTGLAAAYLDSPRHHDDRLWDGYVAGWCRVHGHEVAYPFPSLVDHDDSPTLVSGAPLRLGRTAHRVGAPTLAGGTVTI